MYTLVVAAALLGQCQMINGQMVCPLQSRRPPVVIRYIQIPVRTRIQPAVAKPLPTGLPTFGTYQKWY